MTKKSANPTQAATTPAQVIPQGKLLHLAVEDIIPSRNNPRHLFDPDELASLKKNIAEHGVLVPLTIYQPKGQSKYSILDGERRYRCCRELADEGRVYPIPANIVVPPTQIAGMLYMFSIHNFREQWELMPTALALKTIMDTLGETDNAAITKLTGLSDPQIERCKLLLEFEPKYQNLSLDPDPKTRIPSNFWIELKPVLDLALTNVLDLRKKLGREGVIDRLVEKYRARRIRSVIHFRRIMEAWEVEDDKKAVLRTLEEYITDIELETRDAFDRFILDDRRMRGAVEACDRLLRDLEKAKLDYTLDRDDLRQSLERVRDYVEQLLVKLEGEDPPQRDAVG
jgi:ParB family transcriptional regulator, chromosome partitioning protein